MKSKLALMRSRKRKAPQQYDDDTDDSSDIDYSQVQRKSAVAKRRVLVFCGRGMNARFRHLMNDLRILLPHHKTDVKFDVRNKLQEINQICDIKSCNNCIFFENRKVI